ncbi:MAG TPA: hypothetical protein VKS24_24820 [Bradyrhizobium sp.]|nr:hypothetical protein [Bradyrhizobium sp.]
MNSDDEAHGVSDTIKKTWVPRNSRLPRVTVSIDPKTGERLYKIGDLPIPKHLRDKV